MANANISTISTTSTSELFKGFPNPDPSSEFDDFPKALAPSIIKAATICEPITVTLGDLWGLGVKDVFVQPHLGKCVFFLQADFRLGWVGEDDV